MSIVTYRQMEQVPLQQVLQFECSGDDKYTLAFPPSVCWFDVVSGGIAMAAIHKAAIFFVARNPRTAIHPHVLNATFNFHRPMFGSPQKSVIKMEVSNVNKSLTTLHVQVYQKKSCLEGYVIMTDLCRKGNLSIDMGWQLSPTPIPTTVKSLESDQDPNWVGYRCPFALAGGRKPHTYLEYHVCQTFQSTLRVDQWVTPAWEDPDLPDGAVWTNELIHFALDNGAALFQSEADDRKHHAEAVKVALEQRAARVKGLSDQFAAPAPTVSHTIASVSVTTSMKKPLPSEGVKWLFMRASTRGVLNDRMDQDILLLDAQGDLIATSQHILAIIPLTSKEARL